jgi:hypothetical protein
VRQHSTIRVKDVLKHKPLYQVYEDNYKTEIEIPLLNDRKKKLEELRKFHAPIASTDINNHAKAYEVKKRETEAENKKQRDLSVQ